MWVQVVVKKDQLDRILSKHADTVASRVVASADIKEVPTVQYVLNAQGNLVPASSLTANEGPVGLYVARIVGASIQLESSDSEFMSSAMAIVQEDADKVAKKLKAKADKDAKAAKAEEDKK